MFWVPFCWWRWYSLMISYHRFPWAPLSAPKAAIKLGHWSDALQAADDALAIDDEAAVLADVMGMDSDYSWDIHRIFMAYWDMIYPAINGDFLCDFPSFFVCLPGRVMMGNARWPSFWSSNMAANGCLRDPSVKWALKWETHLSQGDFKQSHVWLPEGTLW